MHVAKPQPAVPRLGVRWLKLTPGGLVIALLVLEGLLLLFDWFHWFPKGCAVLTAVAALVLTMFVMLFWLAVSVLCRLRLQAGVPVLVFVFGLLALEVFLLRSDPLRWLKLSDKTQSTVRLALAAAGLCLLFTLFCLIGGRLFRWRFQFTIRVLLLLFVAVAVSCSWMATAIKNAKKQATAVSRRRAVDLHNIRLRAKHIRRVVGGTTKAAALAGRSAWA